MPKTKSLSFESNMTRLEEIVLRLEDGALPLDEAMKLFREGTTLVESCNKLLDQAELEVVKLTKGKDGRIEEVPFANDELE